MLLIGLGMLAALIVAYDHFGGYYSVGFADLTIVFTVVDSESGEPIPNAEIQIESCEECNSRARGQEVALITDANGIARQSAGYCMWSGSESGLEWTVRRVPSDHPYWYLKVAAPDYETNSGRIRLAFNTFRFTGRKTTEMTAPISLTKIDR